MHEGEGGYDASDMKSPVTSRDEQGCFIFIDDLKQESAIHRV